MKSIRCLLVDDERLARNRLRKKLTAISGAECVGEADNKATVLQQVAELKPDVLLLDVQMPGGDGFACLREMIDPPAVIFVTAYDRFALRAFEVNAVDYLLKPVEPARLRDALDRARARLESGATAGRSSLPLESDDLAFVEVGHSGAFIPVHEILMVMADGNYSRVLDVSGAWRVARQTLGEWETRLPSELFVRLDRKHLLNRTAVHRVEFHVRGCALYVSQWHEPFVLGYAASKRVRQIVKAV